MNQSRSDRPRIGLALGAGSARGWAHIGVIKALAEMDIQPDLIAGTSVGAIVGAIHGLDALAGFEDWVLHLTRRDIIGYMDVGFSAGGFFEGKRLVRSFREHFGDVRFEDLRLPVAAVATELDTGLEIWLREGPVAEAVRASISLPGIFTPVRLDGRWLVDGGLVNPVPVSLCRAMGADRVIAVSLNGDLLGRHFRRAGGAVTMPRPSERSDPNWMDRLAAGIRERAPWLKMPTMPPLGSTAQNGSGETSPGLLQVTASSVNIMQDRITRSRMAGDPPDILISPRLAQMGLLEFDRAREAIAEGEASIRRMAPALRDLFEMD
ncbi:patatin-like phospholipase family protein [Aquisalimonas lutea]|uniref:patatin-like phospholipase family protein n=1 Tax=Aquisalimonas lutea TaxID=1327750 RepID=UPI0025B32E2D|nr:patatin-like phospholipase family protein [Aquisalimonas lutea]MDN3517368.1 patatin-like phospholipase family protein [Aquisalimonas lutea]